MTWKWNKSVIHNMQTPSCCATTQSEAPPNHAQAGARIESGTHRSKTLDATQLQRLYLPDVSRYVRRRVGSLEEAEDITVEVFVAAFAALPKFRHDCDARIWLFRIAYRCVLTSARRRKSRQYISHEQNAAEDETHDDETMYAVTLESPEVLAERAEAQRVLEKLLDALKAEQREALRLQYWEGLSINEIAVVMKRSPAAVNSLLQRARKTLFERGKEYFLPDEVTL